LFQALDGYDINNWTEFLDNLRSIYPDSDSEFHYRRLTLETVVRKQQESTVEDEEQLTQYYRTFLPVAKWLANKNLITTDESAKLFWFGIHGSLRAKLEYRLAARLLNHDRTTPFPIKDIL
jgi:hypothetical protein